MGFEIFGLSIRWYGVIIAAAILIAVLIGMRVLKKAGYKEDISFEVMLAIVPIGILGARLYYIIFSGTSITDFFRFRDGGMAIYGAIIAGAIALFVYTRFIKKCSYFAVADVLVIVLIIAQSIGRWGNYFNSEVYGFEVGFNFFPLTVEVSGRYHLATFFYESILNLIGFFILLKIFSKQKKIGTTTASYLIYYGIVRAILEPLRVPGYVLMIGPIAVSFLVSLIAICAGGVILYLNHKGLISQKNASLLASEIPSEKKPKKPKQQAGEKHE